MARPREGWKIRWRDGRPPELRFTFDGHAYNFGLGTYDPIEAQEKAERIYADTIRGIINRTRKPKRAAGMPFVEAGAEWLASQTGRLRRKTQEVYEVYLVLLSRHFATLGDCTTPNFTTFIATRLAQVQAQTLRKELSVLRSVLQYAHDMQWIRELPIVPSIPRRAKGTRFKQPRRVAADSLSHDEVDALLGALPEWSSSKRTPPFPVRARFILGYELALRPELIDVLSVLTHCLHTSTQ